MPPLIAAILVGAGAYAGFKAVQRVLESFSETEMQTSEQKPRVDLSTAAEKDLGTLEFDPATGVYRPVKSLQ